MLVLPTLLPSSSSSHVKRANHSIPFAHVTWIHLLCATSVQAQTGLSNPFYPIGPILDRPLACDDDLRLPGTVESLWLHIDPRPGLVSPGSSIATDIAASAAWYTSSPSKTLNPSHPSVPSSAAEGPKKGQFTLPLKAEIFRHRHRFPSLLIHISLTSSPKHRLYLVKTESCLALSPDEIDYLIAAYGGMQHDPTDAELFMLGEVNSEHCRHKAWVTLLGSRVGCVGWVF